MAIKYLKAKADLMDKTLSAFELSLIDNIEKIIDSKIANDFDDNGLTIDLEYVEFSRYVQIESERRKLMQKELMDKYERVGWTWEYHQDDGLDGNMSGPDYWVLRGRKDLR